jgi:isopenicillin N synthase-like dioxygenase
MRVVTAEDSKDGHFLKEGGLYIKSRGETLTKVDIPLDCLAFQIGEASQVASRGLLVATPHLVRSIKGAPHLSRNTFAVFLQPNVDHKLTPDLDFDAFTKQVMQRHY